MSDYVVTAGGFKFGFQTFTGSGTNFSCANVTTSHFFADVDQILDGETQSGTVDLQEWRFYRVVVDDSRILRNFTVTVKPNTKTNNPFYVYISYVFVELACHKTAKCILGNGITPQSPHTIS